MPVLFDANLSVREFGSGLFNVSELTEWAKKNRLYLLTEPPFDGFEFVQVESLLCAIERRITGLTHEQAGIEVARQPDLASDPMATVAPGWLLMANAAHYWRGKLGDAVKAGSLRIFDFATLRPIDVGPAPTAAVVTQAAPAVRVPAGLPENPTQRRAALLAMFREAGGKRQGENGKKGTRGALTRVVEKTGIDKDTLGAMLDKGIEEKRRGAFFAELAAKP